MITISKLKVLTSLSHGSLAMTCDVLWHGRLLGHARNTGRGGVTIIDFDGTREDWDAAQAFAATQPSLDLDGTQSVDRDGVKQFQTLDTFVDDLAHTTHHKKSIRSDFTRGVKTKTLCLIGDQMHTFKAPYTPEVQAHILAKYPGALFLNKLQIDEAVELVFAAEKRASIAEQKRHREKEANS